MAGTEAGGKKAAAAILREAEATTVKSAERVDRGQGNKTVCTQCGVTAQFAAESANADLKQDDELAEFENRAVRQM